MPNKSDEAFAKALEESKLPVEVIANLLRSRGHSVNVPETVLRPPGKDWRKFTDSGDIGLDMRVEVKYRPDMDFKRIPYSNIIVDETYKIDKKHKRSLFAYYIVNKSMTGYMFIPVWTREHWFNELAFDTKERRMKMFCFCPEKYVTYRKFNLQNGGNEA